MQNRYLAWKYKQEVIIDYPKTTEGYQATIVVYYKPGMRGDFRDLRFSDNNGNQLYFFIDPPDFAISARVWVRLPANDTLIYMYWGNGAVADGSNGAAVFEFWDDFNKLDVRNQWTVVGGAAGIYNSILVLYSDLKNCMIRSNVTFGAAYALEFRMRRENTNKSICGYWSVSLNMAAWVGTYTLHTTSYNDSMYAKDGIYEVDVDDGVNRSGSTYYIYGIVNSVTGSLFTVDYEHRGTITETLPTGDLPIGFYSEHGKKLEIDWVRVRKYEPGPPLMSLGRRWTTNPKVWPLFDRIKGISDTVSSTDITLADTTSLSTTTEMIGMTFLRQRLYYRPDPRTAYNKWKYKGDISVVSPDATLPDISGNSNNGIMYNVVSTADNLGNPGGAMSFNGVSSYVNCGPGNSLVFGNGTVDSPFSICARLNLTSYGNVTVAGKWTVDSAEYLLYTGIAGNIRFELFDGVTSTYIGRICPSALPIGQWIDIVATYDGSATSAGIKIYINGARADVSNSISGTYVAMEDTDLPLKIGNYHTAYTNGIIANECIYRRELSSTEALAYHNSQTVSNTDLVAQWDPLDIAPIRIDLNPLPGMALDCRDIRFSDPLNKKLSYYVEYNADSGFYYCFVSNPNNYKTIHIHYGNAVSKSESNVSVISTVDVNDNMKFYNPTVNGPYRRWKYKGNININTEYGPATVQIPFYPGMAVDGRDIRFSDANGKELSYYLDPDGIPSRVFIFDVEPSYTTTSGHPTVIDTCGTTTGWSAAYGSGVSFEIVSDRLHVSGTSASGALVAVHSYNLNLSTFSFLTLDIESSRTSGIYVKLISSGAMRLFYTSSNLAGNNHYVIPINATTSVAGYIIEKTGTLNLSAITSIQIGIQATSGTVCNFYIDNITADVATSAGPTINFYYGNAVSESESDLSVKTGSSIGRNQYYQVLSAGKLNKWKYKGDIEIDILTLGDIKVPVNVPLLPGMAVDGRDIRFSDANGKELSYYIDSLTDGIFSCWVLWPANTYNINYYYGNHSVVSNSDVSAFSGLLTGYPDFLPAVEIEGIYRKWKYKGNIAVSNETVSGEQIQIRIPFYPGMAVDGRDIRFSDVNGKELSYYLESFISNVFTCWVKCTAGISTINFYYGNGLVVSKSDPSTVFDFWDDFSTLDSGVWSTFSGTPTASNSTAVLGGTSTTAIRSTRTFGYDTICEMKMYHPTGNKSLCGYWGVGNLREVWEGGYGAFNNDYMHTYNGSTQTNTSGGIDRGGSTYYIYGIAYVSTGPLYYVDYGYIGQITTNLPSGNLPIALYSAANLGNVVVDWVRVRKYSVNTAQVLRHSPQFNNSMPYINDRKTKTIRHYLAKTTLSYYTIPYSNTVLNHAPQLNTTSYYREPSPNIITRHSPQLPATHYYFDYISTNTSTEMHGGEPTFVERRELNEYPLLSVDISRSVNDAYLQLTAEFANDLFPPEGAIVKYYTNDVNGVRVVAFIGKVVTISPTIGYMGNTISMIATDNSRNLIVQHIDWNHQVVYLSDEIPTWSKWLTEIISTPDTGVVAERITSVSTQNKQFVFDPKTTRLDAIKKIAEYCNYVLNIKPKKYVDVTFPAFYAVPPEQIDSSSDGFDLPPPVEFNWPDSTIIDKPTITNEIEEKYNTVIVYGIITSTGETTVAIAYTPSVECGDIKSSEFTINDDAIEENGSTAEIEAIKWLLYFSSPRATVDVKLTKRLDLELYQRVRFGSGFAKTLQDLTHTEQLDHVVVYDPRDETNTTHIVDVSGVPRPAWLRVNEIKYHRENLDETVELKLITDFIYSADDPTVDSPYSTYISPGYIKPVLLDSTSTTQSIVNSAIDKQLSPEICTIISISSDGNTAVVQTQSGKLITVRLK